MTEVLFRDYRPDDQSDCLAIFDANTPEFFAPNERQDYLDFLQGDTQGYQLCVVTQGLVGAFGVFSVGAGDVSLNWIMLDPAAQGLGIGSKIMGQVVETARALGASRVSIAASHKSAPFFEKFGADTQRLVQDGWGPGMHRVDMLLGCDTSEPA